MTDCVEKIHFIYHKVNCVDEFNNSLVPFKLTDQPIDRRNFVTTTK